MESKKGKVFIVRKPGRGQGWHPYKEGCLSVDVSSGGMKKLGGLDARFSFSPMHLGPVRAADLRAVLGQHEEWKNDIEQSSRSITLEYTIARNLENFWQYGKIFEDMGHVDRTGKVTDCWIDFRNIGYRQLKGQRHPKGTRTNKIIGKDKLGRNRFAYRKAISSIYFGLRMQYIESRKKIYAPLYAHLVKPTPGFKDLKEQVDGGQDILILELDVPDDGLYHEVTLELLKKRIDDPSTPFGHGNVVAGLLMDIEPEMYCRDASSGNALEEQPAHTMEHMHPPEAGPSTRHTDSQRTKDPPPKKEIEPGHEDRASNEH